MEGSLVMEQFKKLSNEVLHFIWIKETDKSDLPALSQWLDGMRQADAVDASCLYRPGYELNCDNKYICRSPQSREYHKIDPIATNTLISPDLVCHVRPAPHWSWSHSPDTHRLTTANKRAEMSHVDQWELSRLSWSRLSSSWLLHERHHLLLTPPSLALVKYQCSAQLSSWHLLLLPHFALIRPR